MSSLPTAGVVGGAARSVVRAASVSLPCALVVAALVWWGGRVPAQAAAAQDPVTILDRVFSVAQSDRGESRFKQSCTGCHSAAQFAEPAFSARWEGRTLGDVFRYVSETMPENDPGGLTPAQYVDVIAFFLGQSGYPVGYDDLPADAAALDRIGIVPQPK